MAAVIKMTEETLDSRVARLESDVSFIRSDVADIKVGLNQARDKMDDGFKEVRGEISDLRKETHAELISVRDEIADLRKETHAELITVRGEIAGLRKETHAELVSVRGDIAGLRDKMDSQFWRLVALMIMIALSQFTAIEAVAHGSQLARSPHDDPAAAISQPHHSSVRRIP